MPSYSLICGLLVALLSSTTSPFPNRSPVGSTQTGQLDYPLNRFENEIRAYEKADSLRGIPNSKIVFIGSSSFAYWKTIATDLAPLPVLNRGFGGSTLPEVIYYADRILFPYQPNIIVVYAGENDLNVGQHPQTPEQVAASFKTLVSLVHRRLPNTIMYYVSMKPSPSRWANWATTQRGNQLISAYIKTDKRLRFVDVRPAMLAANGRPRPDLFRADSLHMNARGYAIWAGMLKVILGNALTSGSRNRVGVKSPAAKNH